MAHDRMERSGKCSFSLSKRPTLRHTNDPDWLHVTCDTRHETCHVMTHKSRSAAAEEIESEEAVRTKRSSAITTSEPLSPLRISSSFCISSSIVSVISRTPVVRSGMRRVTLLWRSIPRSTPRCTSEKQHNVRCFNLQVLYLARAGNGQEKTHKRKHPLSSINRDRVMWGLLRIVL